MKLKPFIPILFIASIHLAATAAAFVLSLNFTLPGEPGFNPSIAQRAAFFGHAVEILAFPILPLLLRVIPRSFSGGLLGWVWFSFNSFLWAIVILALWQAVLKRLVIRGHPASNAA